MKFVKEVTGEKMAIPAAALKLCGFENGDMLTSRSWRSPSSAATMGRL